MWFAKIVLQNCRKKKLFHLQKRYKSKVNDNRKTALLFPPVSVLYVLRLGFTVVWFWLGAEDREEFFWEQTLDRMVTIRLPRRWAAKEQITRGTKMSSKQVITTSEVSPWVSHRNLGQSENAETVFGEAFAVQSDSSTGWEKMEQRRAKRMALSATLGKVTRSHGRSLRKG